MRVDMHNDFIERSHLRFNNSWLRASEERGDVVERMVVGPNMGHCNYAERKYYYVT